MQWVLHNAEYTTWLSDQASNLLWVTGYTGCGKTILSSYIIHCLSESTSSGKLVCRFFCNGNIEELRDPCVLLRSIIYQIVYRRRKLLRLVRKASDSQGIQLFNRFDALWDLFIDITRHERAGSINVIIDAIDECEEEVQIMIIHRISKLFKSNIATPIKFFITSRPNTPAVHALQETSVRYIWLNLEENQQAVREDINLVIKQRLELFVKRGRCDAKTRSRLETLLLEKAEQTFLWVSLMLELLERRRLLLPADLQTIAQRLPPNLTTLYERFLESTPPEDRDIAGKLLRLVVVSARPLNVDEIRILLDVDLGSSQEAEHLSFGLGSVQAILGPLIRLSESRIYLVHQSLRDYLIDLGKDPTNPLASSFGVILQRESLMIAQSCIRYLSSADFGEDMFSEQPSDKGSPNIPIPSSESSSLEHLRDNMLERLSFELHDDALFKEDSVAEAERFALLAKRHQLYDYAAMHWATHFAQSNDEANTELHAAAAALCEPGSDRFGDWFRYFWTMSGMNEPYPEVVEPLFVTSFYGQVYAVRRLVNTVPSTSRLLGSALYWAARQGHVSCVETLLSQKKIEIEPKSAYVNYQSPLAVAAQYGHLQCLQALIDSSVFDINEKNNHGRTPTSLAAGAGYTVAVAALLRQVDIDPDLSDATGSTPLFWAVAANSADVTAQLLANSQVNPNHLDNQGRNALSWAAEYGSMDSAKRLMKEPRVDVNNRDLKGLTPLVYATQQGDEPMVRLLVGSKRCDPSGLDINGRNAISWAAERYHYNLLHYLLKHDRAGADIEDKDGWAPLAWALRPPGYTDNIFILTSSGLVNINHRDRDGRSPFSFAAGYGYLEVVKVFSRMNGVEVDSRDGSGRTPFSYAAGSGNRDVVQFLTEKEGVDINSRDSGGRTPLSWAASAGHLAVVEILTHAQGVDVQRSDQDGRPPLWYATHYARQDVAAALELLSLDRSSRLD